MESLREHRAAREPRRNPAIVSLPRQQRRQRTMRTAPRVAIGTAARRVIATSAEYWPSLMSEESTPTDPVELTRRAIEVASRHDLDALMGFFAPDAVFDLSELGIGTFDGAPAIRSFLEDWWGTWRDHLLEVERIVDLGHGVVYSPVREDGRVVGSEGHVEQRHM